MTLTRKIPKAISITLPKDLAEQLEIWMAAEEYPNYAEAIRALMRIALAATPQEGALFAARLRAYNEVRNWGTKRVLDALNEIANDLRQSLTGV